MTFSFSFETVGGCSGMRGARAADVEVPFSWLLRFC